MKYSVIVTAISLSISACSSDRLSGLSEELERAAINDSTAVFDMEACSISEMKLSDLICDVSYVELETTEDSYLSVPTDIKATDSLLYVQDIDGHLRVFNRNGKFMRNGYMKGKGNREVIRLYDFDVDSKHLYLLDGSKSEMLVFTHDGRFVDGHKLPFRASRFKKQENGLFFFELAPYTLGNNDETYEIGVTDSCFNTVGTYFTAFGRQKSMGATRTPYFENSDNAAYFAPLFRRGIYEWADTAFRMKYYLDFKSPYYEQSRDVDGQAYAISHDTYFTYTHPFHTDKYLIQTFFTSKKAHGLLLIDMENKEPLFIKDIVNDRDDVIRFRFDLTKWYDVCQDKFIAISDTYFQGVHSDEEIAEATSHLSDKAKRILVRPKKENGINPILMLYGFKDDIFEKHGK